MAGVSDKALVRMAGWPAGIDNLSPEQSLTRDDQGKTVIAVRDAVNVDLDAAGKPHRRGGYRLALTGERVHSLWHDPLWPFALVVIDGYLCGYRGEADSFRIQSVIGSGTLSYARAGDRVYWSGDAEHGAVRIDGTPAPWGCPDPPGQPALTALPDQGGLDAGRYQVAITWQLESGEESGATLAAQVDVPEGGGIALGELPVTTADVARVRVYRSSANGATLHHVQDLAPNMPVAVLGKQRLGRQLDTQFLETMPAGAIVRHFNGRLYVATDALVWSEALRYGLTQPVNDRLGFRGRIDLVQPVGDGSDGPGIYVAAGDRTYWLGGTDPAAFTQVIAYPFGAVPGTGIGVPGSIFGLQTTTQVAYWMARNGVAMVGLPGGQVLPLREGQAVAPLAERGASLLREQGGVRQVVTALQDTTPNGLAVRDVGAMTVQRFDED